MIGINTESSINLANQKTSRNHIYTGKTRQNNTRNKDSDGRNMQNQIPANPAIKTESSEINELSIKAIDLTS